MDVFKEMFEKNRDAILMELDVSTEFLSLLFKNGLLDTKDCVKYQAIDDKQARNLEMMTSMIECRTDSAYPIFVQCLYKDDQDQVADMLSDLSDEMLAVSKSQGHFYEEIQKMSNFLSREEGRVGLETRHVNTDDQDPLIPCVTQSDVLDCIQDTYEQTIQLFTRSREVIEKLHIDSNSLADLNAEIMSQVKDCDANVRHVLHVNKMAATVKLIPRTAHDMFSILMDDINLLVQYRSRVISKDKEERTQSMRLLRLCRDNIDERNTILRDLHWSTSSIRNPKMDGLTGKLSVKNTGNLTSSSLDTEDFPDTYVQTHAIKTVQEGLHLLEMQIREYIHNEILLTDKYRMELRLKKLKRKSDGYSPHGFSNSNQLIMNIHSGENVTENASKLKVILDKISEEYEECVHYLNRAMKSMGIKESMNDSLTVPLTNGNVKTKQKKEMGSVMSLFKKKPKPSDEQCITSTPVPPSNKRLQLPMIINDHTHQREENESPRTSHKLVDRLKILVTDYEELKTHAQTLGQKFRQDWARKKRVMDNLLRVKEDEVVRLHLSLREMTAEKDKFQKLYEQAKLPSMTIKRK